MAAPLGAETDWRRANVTISDPERHRLGRHLVLFGCSIGLPSLGGAVCVRLVARSLCAHADTDTYLDRSRGDRPSNEPNRARTRPTMNARYGLRYRFTLASRRVPLENQTLLDAGYLLLLRWP